MKKTKSEGKEGVAHFFVHGVGERTAKLELQQNSGKKFP